MQLSPAIRSKLLTVVVAILGCLTWLDMRHFQVTNVNRFFTYLVLALIAGVLKIKLPRVTERVSFYFAFSLLSIVDLSRQETLFITASAILVQLYCHSDRQLRPVDGVGVLVDAWIATLAAYWIYHQPFWAQHQIPDFVPLSLAAVVYSIVGTVRVPVLVALFENSFLGQGFRGRWHWTVIYYLAGALFASTVHIANALTGWRDSLMFVPVFYLVYQSCRLYLERLESEKLHAQDLASLHLRTIEALALAIGAKDRTTQQRLRRIQVYAIEIGKDVGLPAPEMSALQAAAILHDIGKLAVPEHIISKPGKLTNEEFDKMRIHPRVGAEILERVRFPYPVVPIVRSHHEKWDGTGYPNGIKGEQIPMGARILAVVSSFVALTSDRHYRGAFSAEEAMEVMRAESGSYYDPRLVTILERRYRELDELSRVQEIQDLEAKDAERDLLAGTLFEHPLAPELTSDTHGTNFLETIAAAHQELHQMFQLSQDLGTSLSLHETLSVLASRLQRMVPHKSIVIHVVREGRLTPEFVAGDNFRLLSSLELAVGERISGRVAQSNKPVLNGDPGVELPALSLAENMMPLRALVSVPLKGARDVIGVMTLYRTEEHAFSPDHQRILMALASKVALSIENALKFRQAESSATTDYLTGLPNSRSLFLQVDAELARCRRKNETLALVVCDLDGFKLVNDRFGHLQGNELLQVVARRLKDNCREYDYVARMGGDEFVLVFPSVSPEILPEKLKQLDLAVRAAGIEKMGEEIVGLSSGTAFFPTDGANAETLLAAADERMYASKQQRKYGRTRPASDPVPQALANLGDLQQEAPPSKAQAHSN